jgi:NAD(P)-dependent dehydrogenase (short-subunit alcohol dehydrogenase family)
VVATVRNKTTLHEFSETLSGQREIETVDTNHPDQVGARLGARRFDMLFVNAGVKNDDREMIADVSSDEFVRVMVTNALSPMRVIQTLQDVVRPAGMIGIGPPDRGASPTMRAGITRCTVAARRH